MALCSDGAAGKRALGRRVARSRRLQLRDVAVARDRDGQRSLRRRSRRCSATEVQIQLCLTLSHPGHGGLPVRPSRGVGGTAIL